MPLNLAKWGICLTPVIALASALWGGPPGPRRAAPSPRLPGRPGGGRGGGGPPPPAPAGRPARGPAGGRGPPPHIAPQNAGYLSQADTHSNSSERYRSTTAH